MFPRGGRSLEGVKTHPVENRIYAQRSGTMRWGGWYHAQVVARAGRRLFGARALGHALARRRLRRTFGLIWIPDRKDHDHGVRQRRGAAVQARGGPDRGVAEAAPERDRAGAAGAARSGISEALDPAADRRRTDDLLGLRAVDRGVLSVHGSGQSGGVRRREHEADLRSVPAALARRAEPGGPNLLPPERGAVVEPP